MKIIVLAAMAIVTLLSATGSLPKGSVDGAMTLAALFLLAALTVGLYEAWSRGRGVLGWIVNIVVSLVGGLLGAWLGMMVVERRLMTVQPERLSETVRELHALTMLNGQLLFTLAGAWVALQAVNRLR